MKFATKPIQHYPSELRHVATLPWEIKNSNFLQILFQCFIISDVTSCGGHMSHKTLKIILKLYFSL